MNFFNKTMQPLKKCFLVKFFHCVYKGLASCGGSIKKPFLPTCAHKYDKCRNKRISCIQQETADVSRSHPAPAIFSCLLWKEFCVVNSWTSVRRVLRVIKKSVIHFMILHSSPCKEVETSYLWTTVSTRFDNRNVVWRKQNYTWISSNKIHQLNFAENIWTSERKRIM